MATRTGRALVHGGLLQVGEFTVGAVTAYAAVAAVWFATAALWAPIAVALALVGLAVAAELRFGPRVTGLVVGVLPTAVLLAGLLTAFSLVLAHAR